MADQLPKIGDLVAGRYRILDELGRGGYGVVYRARQDVMGRDVALKVLKPEAAKKSAEVERFRREVFHASNLRHPNTIQLFDFGEISGLFYIVMEYLDGVNLRDWVLQNGAVEHDAAIEITLQILKSLREAHEHSIVHRDLKPENIFLVKPGGDEIHVKVLDFGLSKYVEGSKAKEPTLTKEGVIFGTPQYMSPEQAYGQRVRPETDIYALGLLIYEMVTARTAFSGRSSMEILIKQVSQPLPNLPERLSGTLLADFLEICTQKKIEDRFPNAGEAHEWLSNKFKERDVSHRETPLPYVPTPEVTPAVAMAPDTYSHVLVPAETSLDVRLASLPFVGREDELDRLMLWSRQALHNGGVAWVTGEFGVGKTRLIEEWIRHFEMEGAIVLRGAYYEGCPPLEGLREALGPVIDREVASEMTFPQVLNLETLAELRSILLSEEASVRLPEHGQDWAFAAIEHAVFAIAGIKPTVVVLENMHWADSFTQRLLAHWQEEMATRSAPLLLVFSSRTDEIGTSQKLNAISDLGRRFANVSFAQDIHLQPLTAENSQRLLTHLLPLADDVRARIMGLARGNPLFLVEIVRWVIEQGALEKRTDGFYAFSRDSTTESWIPPTLGDLLLTRVRTLVTQHALGSVLSAILTRAVLIGTRFEMRILKDLLRREGRGDLEGYLDDALDRLAKAGILKPTIIGTQAGLEFGYSLTRKALLDASLGVGEDLVRLNRELAEVKVDVYEGASLERRSELAAGIAEHYTEAGDRRASFGWWLTAAEHAERAQDFRAALSHHAAASRLLDLELDPDGDRLLAIRLSQGRLYSFLGEFGPAEYALGSALDEARRVGDLVGEAMSSEQLASVLQLLGRYEEAELFYRSAYKQFHKFNDAEGRLRCAVGLGEISRFKGRYVEARGLFKDAFDISDKKKLDKISIRSLYGLGQCEYASGNLWLAVEIFQKCRKRAEVLGDWRTVSSIDIELAMSSILTDGINKAEQLATHALEAKRRIGDSLGQAHAHLVLGMVLRRSLRVTDADFHCQRALVMNERLSHRYGIGKAVLLEGEIAWVRGDLDRAAQCGNDACALHYEIQDLHGLSLALLYTGLFEIERANLTDAERLIDEALAIGGKEGLGLYQPLGLLFLGMVFEFRDNLEESVAYYGESLQVAERNGNREVASLAAISLAKIHLVLGDTEAVKQEIPIATNLAEKLGNNITLLFALTGSAWLARLMNHAHELQVMMQKMRVLHSGRSGVNLRVPAKLTKLGHQILAHQPPAKARESLAALADIVEGIGDTEGAEHLRNLVP